MECMHGMICGMEHAVRHASTRTKSVCASECVYLCLVVSERSPDGHQCRNDRLGHYLHFMPRTLRHELKCALNASSGVSKARTGKCANDSGSSM